MDKFSKYVGLDVHKETIAVSVADASGGDVRYFGEIANSADALVKLIRQLRTGDATLSFCYEAGPCGYGIHRQLTDLGWDCQVIAPSLIPRKVGDRVKTDRRDSITLARLHRAGELTAVWIPDEAQEALRDATRAREDLKHLQTQARQRLAAFLLRHERRYPGKDTWTQQYYRWLESLKFAHPTQQIVFQEYVDAVAMLGRRVAALDAQIETAAAASVFWPMIEALMALRGVKLLTAATILAEIGDLKRFTGAPQLMAYLGLVPSEYSSGPSKVRGAITKTGNGHVRRVLIEAAWTYRFQARKTAHLQQRARHAPEAAQEIAWNAQKRLCSRYRQLSERGKQKVQVCTAVARELAGFIWAIGQQIATPNQPA